MSCSSRVELTISRTDVFEEFEIDPKENEGHAFQFHDVKRQKAERKQMHGGDCECCQGVRPKCGDAAIS